MDSDHPNRRVINVSVSNYRKMYVVHMYIRTSKYDDTVAVVIIIYAVAVVWYNHIRNVDRNRCSV